MNRTVHAALVVSLVVSACKIERTPPELLTRRNPAEQERTQAVGELRSRLALLGQALAEGEPELGVEVLFPAERVQVVGPVGPPRVLAGSALPAAFGQVLSAGPVRLEGVTLNLAAGADAAWFAGLLREPGRPDTLPPPPPWRVSGLLLLDEGNWRLVQLHFSAVVPDSAATEPAIPEPNPEAPEAPEGE